MAEITHLDKHTKNTVRVLEEFLQEARAGEISALVICAVKPDKHGPDMSSALSLKGGRAGDLLMLVGGLETVKLTIIKYLDAEES